jgi:hypothetical protein
LLAITTPKRFGEFIWYIPFTKHKRMSWYDTVLQESMLPTDSRNSRKIQRIPSNQEFENSSITICQDNCLFKNQEKKANTTKEKVQNNTKAVLKNVKTRHFGKFPQPTTLSKFGKIPNSLDQK